MAQVNEITAEKQCLQDTIYHLKGEVVASSTSLSEALDELEQERAAAVSSHCFGPGTNVCIHISSLFFSQITLNFSNNHACSSFFWQVLMLAVNLFYFTILRTSCLLAPGLKSTSSALLLRLRP